MIPLRDDNPTELAPVLTLGLIAACVLVFLWQLSLGEAQQWLMAALGATPAALLGDTPLPHGLAIIPPFATVFTSMFLHGNFMHIAGNMLYLWIFGNNVEDAMGHFRFILFYFICGVAAVYAQALQDPDSVIPMVGASGAISGVLGAYLLLYPHARVLVAIPFGFIVHTVSVKAGWVLGFWFLLQLVSTVLTPSGQGGVAFGAHLGGFVAGMLLVPFMRRSGVRLFNRPSRRTG
jgi:membrane associated rhomboid family serine protease